MIMEGLVMNWLYLNYRLRNLKVAATMRTRDLKEKFKKKKVRPLSSSPSPVTSASVSSTDGASAASVEDDNDGQGRRRRRVSSSLSLDDGLTPYTCGIRTPNFVFPLHFPVPHTPSSHVNVPLAADPAALNTAMTAVEIVPTEASSGHPGPLSQHKDSVCSDPTSGRSRSTRSDKDVALETKDREPRGRSRRFDQIVKRFEDSWPEVRRAREDFEKFRILVLEDIMEKQQRLQDYKKRRGSNISMNDRNYAAIQIFMLNKYSGRMRRFREVSDNAVFKLAVSMAAKNRALMVDSADMVDDGSSRVQEATVSRDAAEEKIVQQYLNLLAKLKRRMKHILDVSEKYAAIDLFDELCLIVAEQSNDYGEVPNKPRGCYSMENINQTFCGDTDQRTGAPLTPTPTPTFFNSSGHSANNMLEPVTISVMAEDNDDLKVVVSTDSMSSSTTKGDLSPMPKSFVTTLEVPVNIVGQLTPNVSPPSSPEQQDNSIGSVVHQAAATAPASASSSHDGGSQLLVRRRSSFSMPGSADYAKRKWRASSIQSLTSHLSVWGKTFTQRR